MVVSLLLTLYAILSVQQEVFRSFVFVCCFASEGIKALCVPMESEYCRDCRKSFDTIGLKFGEFCLWFWHGGFIAASPYGVSTYGNGVNCPECSVLLKRSNLHDCCNPFAHRYLRIGCDCKWLPSLHLAKRGIFSAMSIVPRL